MGDLRQIAETDDARSMDAFFLEFYTCDGGSEFAALKRDVLDVEEIANWRELLTQCFDAYEDQKFAITIPSLICAFEGVLRDVVPLQNRYSADIVKPCGKKRREQETIRKHFVDTYAWISIHSFVLELYKDYKSVLPNDRTFRHGVLHGTQIPPNDRVESLRLFHAIHTLCNHRRLAVI